MTNRHKRCRRHEWMFHAADWSPRGMIAYYRVAVYRCVHCGRIHRTWGKHRWELRYFEDHPPIVRGGSALAALDAAA